MQLPGSDSTQVSGTPVPNLVALASFKGHGQPSAIVPCPVLPWQVKQRMWKWLFCTRTTSPLQVSPQR